MNSSSIEPEHVVLYYSYANFHNTVVNEPGNYKYSIERFMDVKICSVLTFNTRILLTQHQDIDITNLCYMCVCICVCVCVYIYIYIYIYIYECVCVSNYIILYP